MKNKSNRMIILNQVIKREIDKLTLETCDINSTLSVILKLCDIGLKVKKLEMELIDEENIENYKFNNAEIAAIEEHLASLKEK